MTRPAIREAIERTSAAITADPAKATAQLGVTLETLEVTAESEADNRGMLGLDDGISAGLRAVRMRVRIGGDAKPEALRELVAWADVHSPVGCTVRQPSPTSLDIEVV